MNTFIKLQFYMTFFFRYHKMNIITEDGFKPISLNITQATESEYQSLVLFRQLQINVYLPI